MSGIPIELSIEECRERLRAGTIGRVAMSTPLGPRIVPVNYALDEESIVVRTSPYSELGAFAVDAPVAFEIDEFDHEQKVGWSVVARGRGKRVADPADVRRIRLAWDPDPWAEGSRNLYLRITWQELTGRRLGGHLWQASGTWPGREQRAVTAGGMP